MPRMERDERVTAHGEYEEMGLPPRLAEAFSPLIDAATGPIGRVVGSEKEPAGSHQFAFWADRDALGLDVGHIVVAFSEEAAVIGVVDEPRRFSDVQSFLDDYFDRMAIDSLIEEQATARPEMLVFTVKVLRTKHLRPDVDSHRPPMAGPVWFATPAAIDFALNAGEFRTKVPALLHTNGNYERDETGNPRIDDAGNPMFQRAPIWLDGDYLLGPEAGHANWTGQSGLATKTSHALFLISSAFQTMERSDESVAALMFNVKGPDLLWLDKPAVPDPDDADAYAANGGRGLSQADLEAYHALGLEPRAFTNLRLFAPFRPGLEPQVPPSAAHSTTPTNRAHSVSLEQFTGENGRGKINTARNAAGQAGLVTPILWGIDRMLGIPHKVFDRTDLDDKMFGLIYDLRDEKITSLAQLDHRLTEIETQLSDPDNPDKTWNGHHRFTIQKFHNRVKGLARKFGGLLTDGEVLQGEVPQPDGRFTDQELRVIDISGCNSNVQEVLVSSIIYEVWKLAESGGLGVKKLIVFVDELNKYAPSGGQGGLRDTLVDIAARGRHLNVVLFGAQQFRSKVDDEITGNCGTNFYGRIGDEEIVNAAYRSLSETTKAELLGLPKGRLLVRHPHFRAPLLGAFPMPPTVPGIVGQRVFNDEGNRRTAHPADVVWSVLHRHLGARAMTREQVRGLGDGVDPDELQDLAAKLDNHATRYPSSFDGNLMARNALLKLQQRAGGR